MTIKRNMSFILLMVATLVGCSTTPTGRSQLAFMPDAELDAMGLQAFNDLKKEKPISNNVKENEFVRCIADAITHEVGGKWEVIVFEDKSLNAFALPGSKIGVYTGLVDLVDNQHQLAAVIGHEIAHVLARHSNERMSQQMGTKIGMSVASILMPQTAAGQATLGLLGVGAEYGVIMPFSRLHESEADIIGLDLMAKAGFNPTESITLWQKMSQASQGSRPVEFLSTHPSHETRIEELREHMPKSMELMRQAHAIGKNPNCQK
ncbi:M48 family metallopeptidase [Nitrosomonas sp. PY1]|uniref:M48 family metallopeptidase n=1 Tax=Nitrosomonas sp. PY1 TaxID=1803906 RepID=UPI001FC8B045|nr:M48 family metallopeptidase [Nitrosomonas sp. PY1]